MSKILYFEKKNAADLQNAIRKALSSVEEEFGVTFRFGKGTFNSTELAAKIVLTVADEKVLEEQQKATFDLYARMYGLEMIHYGAVITINDEQLKLVGFHPRRSKFPILFKNMRTGREI